MSVPPQMMQIQPINAGGGGVPTQSQPGVFNDISSLLSLLGQGYGLYQGQQLMSQANTVAGQSNPFGAYRPTYGNQLLKLMQDPSSVSSLPGYQFLMSQGVQAIDRSAAAPGGTGFGSGAEGAELTKYGQGLADQFYQQQVSTLSNLAGANIPPANPFQGLLGQAGAGNIAGGALNTLASGVKGIPNLYNDISNWFSNPSVSPISSSDWASVDQGLSAATDASLAADAGGIGASVAGDISGLFSGFSAAGGGAAGGWTGLGAGGAIQPGIIPELTIPGSGGAGAGAVAAGTTADIGAGVGTDVGAGAASTAQVGTLGGLGFAGGAIAGFAGLYDLFNKESQLSPASTANMYQNNAAGIKKLMSLPLSSPEWSFLVSQVGPAQAAEMQKSLAGEAQTYSTLAQDTLLGIDPFAGANYAGLNFGAGSLAGGNFKSGVRPG